MATCVIITAIVCVLITTVAVIVAFATPNWIRFENGPDPGLCNCRNCDCGMWLTCSGSYPRDGSIDDCLWFFAREFEVEKKLPGKFFFFFVPFVFSKKHSFVLSFDKWIEKKRKTECECWI